MAGAVMCLLSVLIIFSWTLPAFANSIVFSDLGLTHNRFDIYTVDPYNGSTSMIQQLNSSDTWYFDPNANYEVVVRPGLESVALGSPEGLTQVLMDNSGVVLIFIVFVAIVLIVLFAAFKGHLK